MPNLKFLALIVPQPPDIEGPKILKISRDPFTVCEYAVTGHPIFGVADRDLPIYDTTLMGLR